MSYTYDETTQIYTVPFSEFDALLQSLPENTVDTYYKINVTELTQSNFSDVNSAIVNNAKYICLAETQESYIEEITTFSFTFKDNSFLCGFDNLPNTLITIWTAFCNCINLNQPIEIPNSVTSLGWAFCGCTSFNQPIKIPNSVTDMFYTFGNCTNFNQKVIFEKESSVKDMSNSFYGCTSFNQLIEIPKSVRNLQYCFYNCTALESLIILVDFDYIKNLSMAFSGCTNLNAIYTRLLPFSVAESDKWHYVRIDNSDDTNVSYQIYEEGNEFDSDGNLLPEYSGTFERTGNNYELPIATDELIFDTNAPLTDETVKQHLKYKLPFYKNALDPSKENFVLWGANSETFRTNLNISSTFPIGFVYTQYSGTPNPNTLALSVPTGCHWEDITTNYNGEFFRAYKSVTSSEFSESEIIEQAYQTELPSHNHNASGSSASAGNHTHGIRIGSGAVSSNWSLVARSTAYENWDQMWQSGSHTHTISVSTNATSISQETRPINSSIKIWQVQKDTTE